MYEKTEKVFLMERVQHYQTEIDSCLELVTSSADETFDFGHKLGSLLKAGDVVALIGDFGTGKTWLAKGIAAGLKVPNHEYVNSPAFDLIHEYLGELHVYHMDFYRIDKLSIEDYSWLEEYLYGEGVCIIEWADKFIDHLIDKYLKVELFHTEDFEKRELRITAVGDDRYYEIIEGLKR